jgi:hypothetical protein
MSWRECDKRKGEGRRVVILHPGKLKNFSLLTTHK